MRGYRVFGDVYRGRKVLLTGHTGFKGSWLALWLARLGADVTGFALPPENPSLFDVADIGRDLRHETGDVRNAEALAALVRDVAPDFVFHLAAQPLVLESYRAPTETFAVNVMGSINLMEAVRAAGRPTTMVMVTTDKVYRNREWPYGYRESDALGGHDPYSASKAANEIAIGSWRDSFFPVSKLSEHGVRMASARAGNVIGGGDWSANRIVPDLVRALAAGKPAGLRNPNALRPWEHVLEPLAGYLWLGARLASEGGERFAEAWNFGPAATDVRSVGELAGAMGRVWNMSDWVDTTDSEGVHEAGILKLGIDKAVGELGWRPVWNFEQLVERTAEWYRTVLDDPASARAATEADLDVYATAAAALGVRWAL